MLNSPVIANPICPRCGKGQFGIKEFAVQGANYRHFAIICTACGCVVGTETMQDDARKNQLQNAIDSLSLTMNNIRSALQRHGIY